MFGFSFVYVLFASFAILRSIYAVDVVDYFILPIEKISFQDSRLLQLIIEKLAGGSDKVYTSKRPTEPLPAFWMAPLSSSGYQKLHRNPLVARIIPNDSSPMVPFASLTTPTSPIISYTTQSPAPRELRMLSQSPGSERLERFPKYVFRTNLKASDVFIYHAEIGIDPDHPDFQGRDVEWLFTPYATWTGNDRKVPSQSENTQRREHSTCTASKAMGNINGAAKRAKLVVVKMPDFSFASWEEVFGVITDDIRAKNRQLRSIVSVSFGSERPRNPFVRQPEWVRIQSQLEELALGVGVPVILAAGNAALEPGTLGPRGPVDTYPAYFARDRRFAARVIAASNCDYDGSRYRESQYLQDNRYFAPGVDIKCASDEEPAGYRLWSGTSFSAPLIAGVLANIMATGEIPGFGDSLTWEMSAVRAYAGWQRPQGEYVLWNHVDRDHNPPSSILLSGNWLNNNTSNTTAVLA